MRWDAENTENTSGREGRLSVQASPTDDHRPVSLVLARTAEILGDEPFYHELVAGLERGLRPASIPVLLHVVPTRRHEIACYERWKQDGHVQAVVLVDLSPDDERIALVRALGMAAVAVGDPDSAGGLDTVWTLDDEAMAAAVQYLVGLGHRRIAHVGGPMTMAHTQVRARAFDAACARLGARPSRAEGTYLEASGRAAIATLLATGAPPTAVVVDNDLMALGVLDGARALGIPVPGVLSVLAWDDSPLCQLADPPLSAVAHDVQEVGVLTADALLNVIRGAAPRVLCTAPARVVERGSTGTIN